jgi:hypothetical protein
MVPRNQFIACIIRQYGTGLYRTCVSLDQNNSICLGTHSDEKSAAETIDQFLEIHEKGRIKTAEDVLEFLNSIQPKRQDEPFQLPVTIEGEVDLAA